MDICMYWKMDEWMTDRCV